MTHPPAQAILTAIQVRGQNRRDEVLDRGLVDGPGQGQDPMGGEVVGVGDGHGCSRAGAGAGHRGGGDGTAGRMPILSAQSLACVHEPIHTQVPMMQRHGRAPQAHIGQERV